MMLKQMLTLCHYMADTRFEDFPEAVRLHAKQVLLDTLGVVVAGSSGSEFRELADRFERYTTAARGGAGCPGRTGGFDPVNAAFINGVAGSSLEFEEGHSSAKGHPAIQIIPGLTAFGEAAGVSGRNLLRGLILGYEVACRISLSCQVRRGLHPTGHWGTVGSAMGIGVAAGKDAEALAEIAGIASSYGISAYVKNSFAGKNVASTFAAHVNMMAVMSNVLFDTGIRADAGSFKMTFSRFMSEGFDPDELDRDLGRGYAIVNNYFKPYPTCRFTHPALEALKAILTQTGIDPEAVDHIQVESFQAAAHDAGVPENVEALRFSVPYLMAVMIKHKTINLDCLTEGVHQSDDIRALASRVELKCRPEYEEIYPTRSPAQVTITLKDQTTLTHEISDCLGDPSNPVPAESTREKFYSLTRPVLGARKTDQLFDGILNMDTCDNVSRIFALLRND